MKFFRQTDVKTISGALNANTLERAQSKAAKGICPKTFFDVLLKRFTVYFAPGPMLHRHAMHQ
jgi:hypothetical protein